METETPLYATSEKVLIATSSFSLSVSIITELILCYMFTKGSSKVRNTRAGPAGTIPCEGRARADGSRQAKFYLRSLLFAVLLANCVFSLSAFILVAVLNSLPDAVKAHAGASGVTRAALWRDSGAALETPLAQAATARDWLVSVKASQWLCLVVFLLSAVLFVSAWRDLERERRESEMEVGDCERHMGEKGEIFI